MKKLLLKVIWSIARRAMFGLGLGRFRPIARAVGALMSRKKKGGQVIRVGKFRMRLDPQDSLSLSLFGKYEPFATKLVKENLKRGGVVVDVGAHIGYFSLLMSRRVGRNGEVFAFEPNPTNFRLLKENIRLNSCGNISARNMLIGDSKQISTLYLDSENSGGHSLVPEKRSKNKITKVMLTLDDVLKNTPVDLVKIDVQGAEWLVLQGMKAVIAHSPDLKIIMEFAPHSLKRLGASPSRTLDFLFASGFAVSEISEQKNKLIPITNIKNYLKTRAKEKSFEINLYCSKTGN